MITLHPDIFDFVAAGQYVSRQQWVNFSSESSVLTVILILNIELIEIYKPTYSSYLSRYFSRELKDIEIFHCRADRI